MELLPTELRFYAEGNNRTSVLRAAFRFGPVDYIEMDGDGFIRFWGGRRILYTITQVYHGQYLHDDHIPAISDFWIFSGPLYARSLYVIAHRCNDVPKISQSLALGCNDIEIDAIRINGRWYADHGELAAIDRILLVQRTFMRDWADGAAAAYGQFRHQWLVLIVDLKNYAETADLYLQLRERLPHLFIIFSVSHQDSAQGAFGPIWPLQSDRDGYAVDGNNNWGHVVYWFQSRGITRSWYGNGLNAAMNGVEGAGARGDTYRTYAWTLRREQVRDFSRGARCDAVMVNQDTIADAVAAARDEGVLAVPGYHNPFIGSSPG
ncbi:hypothetical protein DFJ74DRAFT_644613 [Hyaloraphidium curvatum]|nr:hypothetical protein DFJ74DRAFT_644613 [Hyaloraphidium curvatum]